MKLYTKSASVGLVLIFSVFSHAFCQSGQWDGFDAGTRNSWYSVNGATLAVNDHSSTGIAGNGLFVNQGGSYRWVISSLFNAMKLGASETPMETIQLSFDFRIFDSNTTSGATSPTFPSSSGSLRFGLYHDNGTAPTDDGATRSDDDIGYRGFIAFANSGNAVPGILRETGTNGKILTGSDSINLLPAGSSVSKVYDSGVFSASMRVTRLSNGVKITVSIYDGPGLTGNLLSRSVASESGSNVITTFNTIAFGSSSNINFRLDNVKVTSGRSRFLLSEAKLEDIRRRVESGDVVLANALSRILDAADGFLDPDLSDIIVGNPSSQSANLEWARTALGRIHILAFAYIYTGDNDYKNAAIDVMDNVCALSDWQPQMFLTTGEMSLAVSIGYNWLYEELGMSEPGIRDALTDNVLSYVPVVYSPDSGISGVWSAFAHPSKTSTSNWNPVCNAGILAATLALAHEYPATAQSALDSIQESLAGNLAHYAHSGVWPEGPIYFSYGGTFTAFILDAFRDVFATDFGLGIAPGLELSPAFFAHIFGPSGRAYNFSAAGNGTTDILGSSGAFIYFSREYGSIAERATSYKWYGQYVDPDRTPTSSESNGVPGRASRADVLKLLWCGRQPVGTAPSLPKDIVLKDGEAELAFFQDRVNASSALWVGVKAGTNGFSHGHLDGGAFILESDGVRWGVDLGSENYSLEGFWDDAPGGQRWTYYRTNNISHNTLTIGGANQKEDGRSEIVEEGGNSNWGYVIIDLSDLYPTVNSVHRGIAMIDRGGSDNTEAVLVQDELSGLDGEAIHWGMVTAAQLSFNSSSTVATLNRSGKTMEARILSPAGATFYEGSTTPPTSAEKQNTGYRKLGIDYTPGSGENFVRMSIVFEPVGTGWDTTSVPAVASLNSWPL